MIRGSIKLNNIERYAGGYDISQEKIQNAIKRATDKLYSIAERLGYDKFPTGESENPKLYSPGPNDNWICGMYTGSFLLAYELTGDKKFLDVATKHMETYIERMDKKIKVGDHDVGFVYIPSCVAYYKVTGDERVRKLALEAAEYLYSYSFSQKGGFIIRASWRKHEEWACRTMMDTMMNIPLFYWAWQETGDQKFYDAANSQVDITERLLMRADGSSYHHYQFDVETHAPVKGLTFQGNRDESTWSRGHAWGISGFPIAYSYNGDENLLLLHRDAVYYMLDHLPEDYVPYWDYDFTDGDEPRDSSAGVISVCGLLEACKYLGDNAPEKQIYKNAALKILDSVIDNYAGDIGEPYDGLVAHVAGAVPLGLGLDICTTYGDFFYLEALLRMVKPDWKRYW
ncbi:MAG: glycoside hydrolase family 88 protein [Clostridia bacterium]|nr:glycoside hydrolase family 88 protein [Clostridia bacterium]